MTTVPQVHLSHEALADAMDSMSVQTFTPEQVAQMTAGSEATQVRA